MFTLPTYGMPCCGHPVPAHADDPATWGQMPPPACSCCRSAARFGAALMLMADPPENTACRGCDLTPAACARSRIKCCPDCDHRPESAECVTCKAVASHPHLRCEDHPFPTRQSADIKETP